MTTDNSRNGKLVHSATSSGRNVKVVMYVEGAGVEGQRLFPVEGRLIARTSEQGAEVARVLRESTFGGAPTTAVANELSTAVSVTLQLGPEMFRFTSFNEWVNKAHSWFSNCGVRHYVAVDTKGRVCVSGREFQRARDEGTFPVVVYETVLP